MSNWKPIETAPKDGTEVLLLVTTRHGDRRPMVGHYTSGGGEEQPHYGPAWFYWTNYDFAEIAGTITHWAPLPVLP